MRAILLGTIDFACDPTAHKRITKILAIISQLARVNRMPLASFDRRRDVSPPI